MGENDHEKLLWSGAGVRVPSPLVTRRSVVVSMVQLSEVIWKDASFNTDSVSTQCLRQIRPSGARAALSFRPADCTSASVDSPKMSPIDVRTTSVKTSSGFVAMVLAQSALFSAFWGSFSYTAAAVVSPPLTSALTLVCEL